MKKLLFLSSMVLVLFFATAPDSNAQRRGTSKSKKESKKESNSFSDHLWFGGGVNLGLGGSAFNFGVSPMVGYKLTPVLSAGVRLPLNYDYFKVSGSDNQVASYSNLDYGLGTFTRLKFFKNIFAHAEYDYIWSKTPVVENGFIFLDPDDPNKVLKEDLNKDEFHLGLGYTSGEKIGYEISVLYDVLEDSNSTNLPFSIRAGFNYKF